MVARFSGRISDVPKTNRFNSALDLEQTLMRHVHLDNTQLPQSALGRRTPMQAIRDWHKSHPHLFVKSPRNHAGRDTKHVLADLFGASREQSATDARARRIGERVAAVSAGAAVAAR